MYDGLYEKNGCMTESLAATKSILYGIHAKSGRAVIENRFSARNRTAVALGGWEMMREIGLRTNDWLLREASLGAFIAMTTPIDVGYDRAIVAQTSLGDALTTKLENELKILHEFNADYTYQARVFGHRCAFANLPASSADETRNALNQDTGVTADRLKMFLDDGSDIFPDRNDSRISKLLGDSMLMEATNRLNDKNHFYRFLRKTSVQFPRPRGVLIDEIPLDILERLERCTDSDSVLEFVGLIQTSQVARSGVNSKTTPLISIEGAFDESIDYFVKVAGSAGGNGLKPSVCRLRPTDEDAQAFKGIIKNLIRRTHEGIESRGIQLLAPIDVREQNGLNPLDPGTTAPFSPCLTYRIGSDGTFAVSQVAEQVLLSGLSRVGSYWRRQWHDDFVVRHAREIDQLGRALSAEGFRGYFGTDFVQNKRGIYEMTVDGNGHMNINDMLHFVRKPLELQGVGVHDIFMGALKFEATDGAHTEALRELCGHFRYSHLRYAGLTLWPSFNADTYLGASSIRKAIAVYVNPSYEPEKFKQFLKLVQ